MNFRTTCMDNTKTLRLAILEKQYENLRKLYTLEHQRMRDFLEQLKHAQGIAGLENMRNKAIEWLNEFYELTAYTSCKQCIESIKEVSVE